MEIRSDRIRLHTLLALTLAVAGSCNDQGGLFTRESEALVATTPTTLVAEIPKSLAIQDVALGATSTLTLADRAKVLETTARPARISSIGTNETNIGVDARTGGIWAGGNVVLRGLNASGTFNVVGDVTAGGTVTLQNNAKVQGKILEHQTIASTQIPFTVNLPQTAGAGQSVPPDGKLTLGPGNYGDVQVFSRATLTLHPGTYFFQSFRLEPDSHVILENSSQPIFLYVRGDFQYRGTFQEQATAAMTGNVFVGILGTTFVSLEAPFVGTIVGPNATLNLATVTGGHKGAFFGKAIQVAPDVVVTHKPFPSVLIDRVTLDKTSVCVGEPLTVTVATRSGVSPVTTSIDMQVGDHRTIQYRGAPGHRLITVIVSGPNGTLEERTIEVTVKDCGAQFVSAIVDVTANQYDVNTANFRVVNATDIKGTNVRYNWSFGDGTSAQTAFPYVEHSYDAKVGPDEEYDIFDATLRVTRDGQPDIVVTKTVTLWNFYAFAKKKGVIEPRIDGARRTTVAGDKLKADVTVQNREATSVTFTQQVLERHFCDPARGPEKLPATAISLSVPAKGTATTTVQVNRSDFGKDVCQLGVVLSGQAAGKVLLAKRYFEVRPNPAFGHQVTDATTAALLKQIRASGLVAPNAEITDRDLARFFNEGRLSTVPSPQALLGPAALADPGSDPIDTPCDPFNDDVPARDGLTCAVVPTEPDTCYGPSVQNGDKGDLLLVASCEEIGQLLRQVNPPQHYSHEGIMTSYRYNVSHSTRSSAEVIKKLKDDNAWSANFLRYGWPGMLHESVATAFSTNVQSHFGNSFVFTSFSRDATRCEGDQTLNPPLVVKPFPGTDDLVRAQLKAAADIANAAETHYRFFAFSQANIGVNPAFDVPASLVGQVGESGPATVSSQSLWRALHLAAIRLEGTSSEAGERAIDPNLANDGLYVYTGQERAVAAVWLMNHISNEISSNTPSAVKALLGIPEALGIAPDADVSALQTTTCFAADVCSLDEACPGCGFIDQLVSALQIVVNPGAGLAVSPDDFFNWDAPHTETIAGTTVPVGAYGYSERLAYSSGTCLPTTRWEPAAGTGEVDVTVVDETGATIRSAEVHIGTAFGVTGADGTVAIRGVPVPAGDNTVLVEGFCGLPQSGTPAGVGCVSTSGTRRSGTATVKPIADGKVPVTVRIITNPATFRTVTFDFTVDLNDDDFLDSDECDTWGKTRGGCTFHPGLIHAECSVDPTQPTAPIAPGVVFPNPNDPFPADFFGRTWGEIFPPNQFPDLYSPFSQPFSECTGDEVKGDVRIRCALVPGDPTGSVNVTMIAVLHEGTSCGADEVDREVFNFTLEPDVTIVDGFVRAEEEFDPTNGSPFDRVLMEWNQSDGAGLRNGRQF